MYQALKIVDNRAAEPVGLIRGEVFIRPRSFRGQFTAWRKVEIGPDNGNNNVGRRCDVTRGLEATFGNGQRRRWMVAAEMSDRKGRVFWLLNVDTGHGLYVEDRDVTNLY